ncbi:GDSL-type esterase/lipase family protein [Effusibacillus pohliae]|uniref:GDSL-type esterase/lipase family protein n=1 Tax=Effusibacillus pohliae TaxID=232270 RepID=UPI000369C1E8|nr:GDSL-type esterase/lipase family protein [Effusibacillus pohliae]
MQSGKTIWYTIATTSIVSLSLLSAGAILAFRDSQASPPPQAAADKHPASQAKPNAGSGSDTPAASDAVPAASPTRVNGNYRVVALGDSLTRGTGDETGQGYVGYLTTELQKLTTNKVLTTNLGVNGMKAPELLQYIQSPDVRKEIQAAHLITLSIGGNDLVRGAGPVTAPDPQLAKQTREQYLQALDRILKEIRSLNGKAPVLFVGLYNPFPLTGQSQQTALQILDEWNLQTSQVLAKYPYAVLVPTQDLFAWNSSKLLSVDQFHPNAQGYQAIAQRMLQDVI